MYKVTPIHSSLFETHLDEIPLYKDDKEKYYLVGYPESLTNQERMKYMIAWEKFFVKINRSLLTCLHTPRFTIKLYTYVHITNLVPVIV